MERELRRYRKDNPVPRWYDIAVLIELGKSGMENSSKIPMLGTLWTSGSSSVKCWASEMISKGLFQFYNSMNLV